MDNQPANDTKPISVQPKKRRRVTPKTGSRRPGQHTAPGRADVALIISQALPKHIEHFDLVDNVWVAHPRCALPVAVALRQSLIELSNSRFVQQGQETKMEQVYKYLTGMKFRQRVEAVIEKFNDMREDLERERKFMGKQWSKREAQILAVVNSTVGMVGDLQGIAGKAMPEIPSLDMPLLEASTDPEAKVS